MRSLGVRALANHPLSPRNIEWRPKSISDTELNLLLKSLSEQGDDDEKAAALVIAWYLKAPLSDDEIVRRAEKLRPHTRDWAVGEILAKIKGGNNLL
jgi:hypothetical protein